MEIFKVNQKVKDIEFVTKMIITKVTNTVIHVKEFGGFDCIIYTIAEAKKYLK